MSTFTFALLPNFRSVLANDICVYFNYVEATWVFTQIHIAPFPLETEQPSTTYYINDLSLPFDATIELIRKLPYYITDNYDTYIEFN
jgi:hypothetical protein